MIIDTTGRARPQALLLLGRKAIDAVGLVGEIVKLRPGHPVGPLGLNSPKYSDTAIEVEKNIEDFLKKRD